MRKLLHCFMSLVTALYVSLIFSCNHEIETIPEPTSEEQNNYNYWCVYDAMQQCFATNVANCPGGGTLSGFCPPFQNGISSSSPNDSPGESNNNDYYCIYDATQQCFAVGSQATECPADGLLSLSCPFGNNSGGKSSSGKSSTSKSSSGGNSSANNNLSSSLAGNILSSSSNVSTAQKCNESSGPVACYGKLKASGNKLIGSKTNSTVQVRGVSLGWSNTGWGFDRFFTAATVNAMVDDWKAEVIRVPIGYSEDGGYSSDPSNLTRVKAAIDAAIAKGVYVIIDWHSHNAHNELTAATSFFNDMAKAYGSKDHVIFELYNEPLDIDWSTIKTYSNSLISTIRQYSDNLILVGTPSWDQKVNVAAGSQVSDPKNNIAYVFHFYAYSHTRAYYESNVNATLSAGYPVFVSEYGTTHSDGGCNPSNIYADCKNGNQYNSHDATSSDAWHTYMDNNKISSCAWNLSDVYEGSAFFGIGPTGSFNMKDWTNTSSMTPSGQYIFNKLRTYANSAQWRGGSVVITPSSSSNGSVIITSSSSVSGGGVYARCKDGSGRDYFCEWGYGIYPSENPGCFAIDPTYSVPKGQSCSALVSECEEYGSLYINSTEREGGYCNGTRVSPTSTPSSSSVSKSSSSVSSSLYCDFGYPTTASEGGCFPIDYASECDTEYGKVVTSCGRTDLIYCDWGPVDPYYGDGGCYIVPDRYTCTSDYGTVVSRCPTSSL